MKYAVIGDVHEKYGQAKNLYKTAKHMGADHVIFVGDWYDAWELDLRRVGFTAGTHYEMIQKEDVTSCMGNHDIQYRYPHLDFLKCSGYNPFKHTVIDAHMNLETWRKVKYFVWANGVLVSHAGIHPVFSHPVYGINEWVMGQYEDELIAHLDSGRNHWMVAPGSARGGRQAVGGIDWLDFHNEFEPVPGLNQIVGHTSIGPNHDIQKGKEVRTIHTEDSKNYCIDTGLRHIAFVEENGDIFIETVK